MSNEDDIADFFGRYFDLLEEYEKEILERMQVPKELLGKPNNRSVGQLGSPPALGAGSHRFESCRSDQEDES